MVQNLTYITAETVCELLYLLGGCIAWHAHYRRLR